MAFIALFQLVQCINQLINDRVNMIISELFILFILLQIAIAQHCHEHLVLVDVTLLHAKQCCQLNVIIKRQLLSN